MRGDEISGRRPNSRRNHARDDQLEAIFGRTVFNRWTARLRPMPAIGLLERLRLRLSWRHTVLAFVLAVAVPAVLGALQLVRKRSLAGEREEISMAVGPLLLTGSYQQLAERVPAGLNWIAWPDAEVETDLVLAEALLFRYHDAAPARAARVLAYLARHGTSSPALLAARATLAPQSERAALLGAALDEPAAADPLLVQLAASARERSNASAAKRAYRELAVLAPTHLVYMYGAAAFHIESGAAREAGRYIENMTNIEADAIWTALAESQQLAAAGRIAAAVQRMAKWDYDSEKLPPVQRAELHIVAAGLALRQNDQTEAARRLAQASAAVQHQAAFLRDWSDRLVSLSSPVAVEGAATALPVEARRVIMEALASAKAEQAEPPAPPRREKQGRHAPRRGSSGTTVAGAMPHRATGNL